MKRLTKQFSLHKFSLLKISLEKFFVTLIVFGIPLNFYKNRFYDNYWTIGEWLISYAGGFVRRGLPGQIIYYFSNHLAISPIVLIWIISFSALISLAILLINFCKNLFEKSFLLSQLVLLGPVSEDYFIRKDSFLVLLYGLSLLTLKAAKQQKLSKFTSAIFINIFSIIAILSHESYGIWGLPSLIIIFYLFERSTEKNFFQSCLSSILYLTPTFTSFIFCWIFKGNKDQALIIHQSWQGLKEILPSLGALNLNQPDGAIAAIGWGTSQVYTSSLLSKFNLLIFWHPGMWLLTIFIVIKLFIGKKSDPHQKSKRVIICLQLISFLPMFLFVDIGRWIFMWLSSSALLFSFLIQVFGTKKVLFYSSKFKRSDILPKLLPGFDSIKTYNLFLLFLGLPHCCWSIGRYIVSSPIGFSIKNIIFYFKIIFL